MKKQFYLLGFFFAITLCSQAQIKKGDVLLGGTLGFFTQKTTTDGSGADNKQSGVNLTPGIGRAIKDNLVAGFDLTYNGSSTIYTNYSSRNRAYGAGVFLRRYTYLGSGFAIFAQTRLGGQYNTQKDQNAGVPVPGNDTKGYSITASFYPGIAYAITKRVQLETGFANLVYAQYSHAKNTGIEDPATNTTYTNKTNGFSLQTSLTSNYAFAVGIRVLLGS